MILIIWIISIDTLNNHCLLPLKPDKRKDRCSPKKIIISWKTQKVSANLSLIYSQSPNLVNQKDLQRKKLRLCLSLTYHCKLCQNSFKLEKNLSLKLPSKNVTQGSLGKLKKTVINK